MNRRRLSRSDYNVFFNRSSAPPSDPNPSTDANCWYASSTGTRIERHADILETVTLHEDRRRNDLPYRFYGLNEEGRRFLEVHKLLRAEETLRKIYSQVEKTESIK